MNKKLLSPSVSILSILLLLTFGCSKRREEAKPSDSTMAPAPMANQGGVSAENLPVTSSAAKVNPKDTVRKFIRTADLKFKVPDVIKTTYKIEDLTVNFGGFVEQTTLQSDVQNKIETPVSEDSTLETTYYVVTNSMTLRVPDVKLDTTLKSIAPLIEFLDSRTVSASDVRFDILENDLAINRSTKQERRITTTASQRGKQVVDVSTGEDHPMQAQETADEARVANLRLQDQIAYSTIHLNIYQRQSIRREVVGNDKNITAYTPGLGMRVLEALRFGWETLESIIVSLVKIWGILAFIAVLFVLYKIYVNRTRSNDQE